MPKKLARVAQEAPQPVEAKRSPGRPRKVAAPAPTTKRKPGRPKAAEAPARTPVVAKTTAKVSTAKVPTNGRQPKAGSKTEKIYKLLTRKSGCTRPEVLEATQWPSISMQHTAGLLRLKLRTEKHEGKSTRYYGSP